MEKPIGYLWAILIIFLGLLIYLLSNEGKIKNTVHHCGWNGNIYIACNGDNDIDFLVKEFG